LIQHKRVEDEDIQVRSSKTSINSSLVGSPSKPNHADADADANDMHDIPQIPEKTDIEKELKPKQKTYQITPNQSSL